ncbi:MAG: phosphotransferase [Nitrospinae bacterium]|nr:phosphotransferase [Nitrospinota bacterium]
MTGETSTTVPGVPPEVEGRQVVAATWLGGGRNSAVYLITLEDGDRRALKRYFGKTMDGRSRMEVEFSALRFLWDNGFRNVPRPVMADSEGNQAVYGYIEGEAIGQDKLTAGRIDELVGFAARLKQISGADGGRELFPASEACFSLRAVMESVRRRYDALENIPVDSQPHDDLKKFLGGVFKPSFDEMEKWVTDNGGLAMDEELGVAYRTLSQSDFGFHNTVLGKEGQLVFVDFEYFGWDDPAKMICDFLLSPAMTLTEALKRRFLDGAMNVFGNDGNLPVRVRYYYPLFGLKWAMIMLNDFLPGRALRQAANGADAENIRRAQLRKAERMTGEITKNYANFYCGA